ncbi:hypothetical protein [Stenotrophomonas sp. CFBP 13725]|uniref:hypothetical protein n=1 Tax=Stenotrophomonas sp. CFBP 13725 TaxID=2775297 RepID=UPI001785C6A0|nr:hypothetical protein [Stenotrophomonas sp. CFBP 13725]MBD8635956.1 hypothetical protein [Stenotrophomonas sp. CFBP 13725]
MLIHPSPSFTARAVSLAAQTVQRSTHLTPSQVRNAATGRSGYQPLTQAVMNRLSGAADRLPKPVFTVAPRAATRALAGASMRPPASVSATRCAFTGLALRNGRFSAAAALASLSNASRAARTTAAPPPAANFSRSVVAVAVAAAAAVAAPVPPKQEAAPPTAPLPSPSRPTAGAGEAALKRIAHIRQQWQSGFHDVPYASRAVSRTL